jgi:hypothetical protein
MNQIVKDKQVNVLALCKSFFDYYYRVETSQRQEIKRAFGF